MRSNRVLAALLADLLLGNYGCTPYLTVFVVFHASEFVSVRFAAVLALLAGTAFDLAYGRTGAVTPLLMTAALFSGRLAFDATGGPARDRKFSDVLLPGAVMGVVMSLGEVMVGRGENSWLYAVCTILSGAFFGLLECAAVLTLLDAVAGSLGVRGFLSGAPGRTDRRVSHRRIRRVRAVSIGRRNR